MTPKARRKDGTYSLERPYTMKKITVLHYDITATYYRATPKPQLASDRVRRLCTIPMQKTWRCVAVIALCLIGAVVSTYLTTIHLHHLATGEPSLCNFNQMLNCDVAISSRFSEVQGVPIAHLGMLFYLGMGTLAVVAWRRAELRPRLHGYMFIGAFLAAAVSLLLFLASMQLRALCVFCFCLYIVNLTLLVITFAGGLSAVRELPAHLGADARALFGSPVRLGLVLLALVGAATATYELAAVVAKAHAVALTRDSSARIDLVDATAPSMGPADAPVTLVEVSDFECPFCQRASETVAELRRLYPDRLRIVFRNFPLDQACNPLLKHQIHENACAAARAAICAGEQGKFWPYAELLFSGATEPSDLLPHARTLGLSEGAFSACLAAPATAARVAADIAAASHAGVVGVPVFLINGRKLTGAKPLEDFRAIIDDELKARR